MVKMPNPCCLPTPRAPAHQAAHQAAPRHADSYTRERMLHSGCHATHTRKPCRAAAPILATHMATQRQPVAQESYSVTMRTKLLDAAPPPHSPHATTHAAAASHSFAMPAAAPWRGCRRDARARPAARHEELVGKGVQQLT